MFFRKENEKPLIRSQTFEPVPGSGCSSAALILYFAIRTLQYKTGESVTYHYKHTHKRQLLSDSGLESCIIELPLLAFRFIIDDKTLGFQLSHVYTFFKLSAFYTQNFSAFGF